MKNIEITEIQEHIILTALTRLANEYYEAKSMRSFEMTCEIIEKIKNQENGQ